MEIIKKIKIGSAPFFECYEDFTPTDTDWLCLVDGEKFKTHAFRAKIGNDDIILYNEIFTKEDFINEALEVGVPFKIGKFLVPEFIEAFGVTAEDLEILRPLIERLDDAHAYEKIIFDAYVANGCFVLTDEQRRRAYHSYKAVRGK